MSAFLKTITNSVKHWYILLIIGLILIAFGIYIFTVPLETYLTLSFVFSTSFIVAGVLEIFFSIQNHKEIECWGWYLTGGILDFFLGIILFVIPIISITTLPFFVGFTLLFRSFRYLGFAFDLKNYGVLEWGYAALSSVISILFSFILIANPIFTGFSLITLTALSFIFAGISAVTLSFSMKKLKNFPSKVSSDLKNRFEKIKEEYKEQLNK
jgi:uncharacterized membrane protein HdeD (DUF308 family)